MVYLSGASLPWLSWKERPLNVCSTVVVVVRHSGNSTQHTNKVTLHQAWLVLRWVTICVYTVLMCNQNQCQLIGMGNGYWPKCIVAADEE